MFQKKNLNELDKLKRVVSTVVVLIYPASSEPNKQLASAETVVNNKKRKYRAGTGS